MVIVIVIAVVVVILMVLVRRKRASRPSSDGETGSSGAGRAPATAHSPRRRKKDDKVAEPSVRDPIPVFNVVTVGPRGAGKTLLLASMFHELKTTGGRSYFLTAPHDQVIALNEWYFQAADPERSWPAGTASGETRTFSFDVRAKVPSGPIRPVLRVNYLEYSGGLLTDAQAPGSTAQAEVLQHIDSAHGLVGILDGFRIRQLLDGNEVGYTRLAEGIDTLISLMMLASCPVTFVITKWDLLRDIDIDENASLKLVKKQLLYIKGFRDLVEQHSDSRVVRLIPVSAVGPDFAAIDQAGRMAKLPGAEVNPTNVDVPLCALVPDLFEQIEMSVDTARMQAEFARISKQTRLGPAAAAAELGRFLAFKAGRTLISLGPGVAGFLGDAALDLFGIDDGAEREGRQSKLSQQLTAAQQDFENFRIARRQVLREFQRRVDVLEGRLPSSRLLNED